MTKIFYFSGTGNSKAIAQGIAERLGGAEVVPITRAACKPVEAGCRVGIVSPVYFLDLPDIVSDFVSRLSLPPGTPAFGVVNMGMMDGNSLDHLRRLLLGRGAASFAGYRIQMPDNSVAFETKPEEIPVILKKSPDEIARVAANIAASGSGELCPRKSLNSVMSGATTFYCNSFLGFKKISADASCVGCGVCAKACPVGNIEMIDGKPVWKDGCESCFACIHRCPKKAVGFRRMNRAKLNQYVHPSLT